MNIHEYQAKAILQFFDIAIPESVLVNSADEVADACLQLGGDVWVVKAQAHTGSRGKGGGVVVCGSVDEVKAATQKILSQNLITPQTTSKGLPVHTVLIEKGLPIDKEIYVSINIDRSSQQIAIITSNAGGGDIEEIAKTHPEKIINILIDITQGLTQQIITEIATKLSVNIDKFGHILQGLYDIFISKNCNLIEINPLIVSNDELIALDCKMEFDDNALFKHEDISSLRDIGQEDAKEVEAAKYDLNYISLDGDIGCMVNGAGLAMATMDLIGYHGGKPANFLDVGGGTTSEKVAKAFEIIQSEEGVRAIFVNIFGGIVRCDLIAQGILQAIDEVGLNVPLVVRLEGTNSQQGLDILANSSFDIIVENDLTKAAKKVVGVAK
jgi:succinyl-CoA synthetase beta subunit